jgi:hypothetical protein
MARIMARMKRPAAAFFWPESPLTTVAHAEANKKS